MTRSIELDGVEEFLARLKKITMEAERALGKALFIEGELVMTDSKMNYVPVWGGDLRASGHVREPEKVGTRMQVTLGYGGDAAAYALAVHEVGSDGFPGGTRHPWFGKSASDIRWSVRGTGAKYLEKPLKKAAKGMGRRLADRMARDIRF